MIFRRRVESNKATQKAMRETPDEEKRQEILKHLTKTQLKKKEGLMEGRQSKEASMAQLLGYSIQPNGNPDPNFYHILNLVQDTE